MKKLNYFVIVSFLILMMSCNRLGPDRSVSACIWTETEFFAFSIVQLSYPNGLSPFHLIQTFQGSPENDLTLLLTKQGDGGISGHEPKVNIRLHGDGTACVGQHTVTYFANSPNVFGTAVNVITPSNGGVGGLAINVQSDDYNDVNGTGIYYYIHWMGGSNDFVAPPFSVMGEKMVYTIDSNGRQVYMPDGSNGSNYIISDGEEIDILP